MTTKIEEKEEEEIFLVRYGYIFDIDIESFLTKSKCFTSVNEKWNWGKI